MAIISPENLLKVLTSYNPWWKTGSVNAKLSKTYKRFAFYEAMKRLLQKDIRRTVVLTGTRRVGKTTIQYQMIETLLQMGVSPLKIVFISMDHPMLKLSAMQDILNCYHENIYPEQDVYYFFDEIQYAQDWDQWLKTLYDMQPDTKIVATGSASPALVKGGQESGAGRWTTIQVPTMSFYEYCELIGVDRPNLSEHLKITPLLRKTHQERTQVMLQLSKVQNHFNRYLQVGGFPELALADNDILAQQIMREDVVDKVLKRDLPSLYNIRNSTELERIFLYLCNVSSEIVSIDAIAKELNGVSRPTVENYIRYLESANLIYQSWPVNMDAKKVLKARPKIYIADAAIRNAVLMDDSLLSDPVEMGKVVETAVYKHVAAFYYQQATSVGYYRGGKRGKEIDIVVEYGATRNILIEVKYRESAPIADDDSIVEMSDRAVASIVVTKNADDFGVHNTKTGKDLIRIPAFAFLYLLGHAEKHGYHGMDIQ
ncbi:MAG TPA: ATP-binding protein [Candidatus Pullichristensenella stercorigallinarum]|uniref:ATP-binding protein n=1 Tax=Candidatus Pullichristensenella stercorigallinarum TaxID=2840909 RepID=A0A9D1CWE4_9FIRM|nr:ATP-binding protein [Candidatus Pullichristensenella stercorigallinarum]